MPEKRDPKEGEFEAWYAVRAKKLGLNPNPDDPRHYYDYRAAWRAGVEPTAKGKWSSKFKKEGHPHLIVEGKDTRTGSPIKKPEHYKKGNPHQIDVGF